jgi:hypothetical protein
MKPWIPLLAVLAANGASADAAPQKFDLICSGSLSDLGLAPKPFSIRMRIDLSSMRYCFGECGFVRHLSGARGGNLEYHYDVAVADQDHAANHYRPAGLTTAGPWDFKDDFAIDLATGRFTREYRFDYGDPASMKHLERFSGRCTRAEFTPLPNIPTPGLAAVE